MMAHVPMSCRAYTNCLYSIYKCENYSLTPLYWIELGEGSAVEQQKKALFNRRQSAAQTVMSENLFGVLLRRWPYLTVFRLHVENAQKVIYACCVLENIARSMGEPLPEAEDNGVVAEVQEVNENLVGGANVEVIDEAGPVAVRNRGLVARQIMINKMAP